MRQKVTLWFCALPLFAVLLIFSSFASSSTAQASSIHPIGITAVKLVSAAKKKCPPLLSYGDIDRHISGNVYLLQASLNYYAGMYRNWQILNKDGNFGPRTLAMVKRFQGVKHLDVDGIVGPKTWHALGWC